MDRRAIRRGWRRGVVIGIIVGAAADEPHGLSRTRPTSAWPLARNCSAHRSGGRGAGASGGAPNGSERQPHPPLGNQMLGLAAFIQVRDTTAADESSWQLRPARTSFLAPPTTTSSTGTVGAVRRISALPSHALVRSRETYSGSR